VKVSQVVLALLATGGVVSCGPGDAGKIGSGAIGVKVRNACDRPIVAEAAESPELVRAGFAHAHRIEPGIRVGISIVTNVAYYPKAFFIGVGPDADHLTIAEFDIEALTAKLVETTFEADCITLTTAP
jgi:hypothetical protein